jgi:hypothetical protein
VAHFFAPLSINVKRIATMFVALCTILLAAFVYFLPRSRPPRESKLIDSFYAHRSAYERLKDMLFADEQLHRVATWGVETNKSDGPQKPPVQDFSSARYHEYLALLEETGAKSAFRERGQHPKLVAIGIWASGWGGNTRHIDICWMDHAPTNQVSSLDDYYRNSTRPRRVFRHIDGNWYLFADW